MWNQNFALVEQCVNETKSNRTIDDVVFEFSTKVDDRETFLKVFWFILYRAFRQLIHVEYKQHPALWTVKQRIENKIYNKVKPLEHYHINYLFKKHPILSKQIQHATIVDFNYDCLFKYIYTQLYWDQKIKENEDSQKSIEQDLRENSFSNFEDANDSKNRYEHIVEQRFTNISPSDPREIILNNLKESNIELEANRPGKNQRTMEVLNNYFQPHGKFTLDETTLNNPTERAFWRYENEADQNEYYPKTYQDVTNIRFKKINSNIREQQPTEVIILGISLKALENNLKNISFPQSINKVFFTCHDKKELGEYKNSLSEMFVNCEMYGYPDCTKLWEGLGSLYYYDDIVIPNNRAICRKNIPPNGFF